MNIESSIALDVLSVVFMLALLIGLAGVRTGRLSDKLYFVLIVFVEVLLLSDVAYLFCMGNLSEQTVGLAVAAKSLYFIANAVVIWMWARYVDVALFGSVGTLLPRLRRTRRESESRPLTQRIFRMLYHGALVVNIAIVLVNLPTGWMFSIAADGTFSGNTVLMWVYTLLNYGVGALVIVALIMRRRVIGSSGVLLSFILFPLIPLVAEMVQLVDRSYALTCAYALSAMMLYQVSRNNLIYTDELTSLGNRRLLHRGIDRWFSDPRTKLICGIMIDLDGLKRINDTFGHAAGDEALVTLADLVRRSMPQSAVAARYGGDEFVIAWSADHGPHADQVLEQLEGLRTVANEHPATWGELEFSVGALCCLRDECPGQAQFMEQLDQAMYSEKRSKTTHHVHL